MTSLMYAHAPMCATLHQNVWASISTMKTSHTLVLPAGYMSHQARSYNPTWTSHTTTGSVNTRQETFSSKSTERVEDENIDDGATIPSKSAETDETFPSK